MTCELKDKALDNMVWVMRIIFSCRDTFQIECAKNLIKNFDEKYKDETLTTELNIAWQNTYNLIHTILN